MYCHQADLCKKLIFDYEKSKEQQINMKSNLGAFYRYVNKKTALFIWSRYSNLFLRLILVKYRMTGDLLTSCLYLRKSSVASPRAVS